MVCFFSRAHGQPCLTGRTGKREERETMTDISNRRRRIRFDPDSNAVAEFFLEDKTGEDPDRIGLLSDESFEGCSVILWTTCSLSGRVMSTGRTWRV